MRQNRFIYHEDTFPTDYGRAPKSWPCFDCGRDVPYQERCICVPSQDRNTKIGATPEADRLMISPEQ